MNIPSHRWIRHSIVRHLQSVLLCALGFISLSAIAQEATGTKELHWDWHNATGLSWQDSIASSRDLSEADREKLVDIVASKLRPFNAPWTDEGLEELRRLASRASMKQLELSDVEKDIIVQGHGTNYGCNLTGNCPLWIFRRSADGYQMILHGIAQTFIIQETRTNGRHDIVFGMRGSGTLVELKLYRFDGSEYQKSTCYQANRATLDQAGAARDMTDPRITSCKIE